MSYTVTLNRAHKIVERLRQHVTDTSKALRAQVAPVRVRNKEDIGAKVRAEARQVALPALLSSYGLAVDALELLRNVISKGNTANGIDVLLAKQNRINQELVLVKEMVSDAALESTVAWEHVAPESTDYSSQHLASLTAEQAELLNKRIRTLQTELHAVSDQVSDANRASVSVTLSDELSLVVGLKA